MGARCSTIKPRGVIKPSRKVDINSITPTQRNGKNHGRKGSKSSSLDDDTQIENLRYIDNTMGVMIKQKATSAETPSDDSAKHGSNSQLNETNANTSRITENSNTKKLFQYKKGPLIGKGAYGEVFECLSLNTGELLAVKSFKLYGDLNKVMNFTETLKKEITILRSLYHQNIVKYYTMEITEVRENNYAIVDIVQEYVSGGSVRKLLDKFNKLEEKVIATYTRQVLEGLTYLHMNGILHRNIKGSNVLIDTSGIIKLTDFGCSGRPDRFSEENPQENNKSSTVSKGPAYWSAPEVIMRKAQGKPADVWSVGCVVLEMLTGSPPWANSVRNMEEFVRQITLGTPPPFPKDISENCRDFLYKTFKFKPEDRLSPFELLDHPFVREDNHDNSYIEAESVQTMQTSNGNTHGRIHDLLKLDSQQGDKKYMDLKTNNFVSQFSSGNVSVSHVKIGRVATNMTAELTSSLHITKPMLEYRDPKAQLTYSSSFEKDPNFMMTSQKFKKEKLRTLSEANQDEECSPLPFIKGNNRYQFSGNQNKKSVNTSKEDDPKIKEARRKQLEEEMNRDLQRISTGQLSEFAAIEEENQEREDNDIEPTSDVDDEKTGNYKKRAPPIPIKNSLFTAKGARGGLKRDEMLERPIGRKDSMKREETENKTDNNLLGVPVLEDRLCNSDLDLKSSNSNVNDHEKRLSADEEMGNILQTVSVDDLKKFQEEHLDQMSEEEKKKHQERRRKQFEEQMELSLARVNSEKVQGHWDRDGQSETSEIGENKLADRLRRQFEEESDPYIRLSADNVRDTAEEHLDIENISGRKFEEDVLGNSHGWENNKEDGYESDKFVSPQMTESDGRSPEDQRKKRPADFSRLPYKEALSASSKNENFDKLNDSESFDSEVENTKGREIQIIDEDDNKLGVINEAEELKEDSSDDESSRNKADPRKHT